MINFKNKEDVVPSALIVGSILILMITLGYMILVPKPTVAGVAAGRQRSKRQIEDQIDQAKERSKQASSQAETRLWKGNPDTVIALVLAQLTTRAQRSKVQMSAFRPQKPTVLAGVTELPCNAQISGPYETVLAFLGTLDEPESHVALRSLAVASADGATSTVTATVGLSVYYVDDKAPVAPTTPSKSTAGVRSRTSASLNGGVPRG